ncbi:MAG: A/G-specific adenine glycosylase [Actinomycetota bacterium]|nr:A/G-specific adenine glycosylase [Actinomycetota bacterium]MDH5224207.1 A/G-specific adenine glycosylase [Actinomycetota bacterium]MDH5312678.1 A/G-specific adenine glycosylase [Actinomycetota bacterium]
MSEVMLQQTQAGRVVPAFEAFMRRFPDVGSLAGAPRADVLRAWGRLGFPRRAVALHRAAGEIVERFGGDVPEEPASLRTLPGVGEYTAAAVASLAFGVPVAAIDTNVKRVWARVDHGCEPDEVATRPVSESASSWLDTGRPADWNQAVMDLGREVCRPTPRCPECPLRPRCAFASGGRTGRPSSRRRPKFEGSLRQVRGGVTAALRERSPRTFVSIVRSTGWERERVAEAIRGLHRDGVVAASPAALQGRDLGRVSFPE